MPDNDLPPRCAVHPPPSYYLPRRLPSMNYIERLLCTLLPTGFFQQRTLAGNGEWGRGEWGHAAKITFRPKGMTAQLQLVLITYYTFGNSSLWNKLPLITECAVYFLSWPWLIYLDKVKILMAPLTFLCLKYFLNFLPLQSFSTLTFKMPGFLLGAIFKFFPKLANLLGRPQPSRRNFMKQHQGKSKRDWYRLALFCNMADDQTLTCGHFGVF